MAPDWKNPMLKVKARKVVLGPLEPISIQDVRALINTCRRGDFIGSEIGLFSYSRLTLAPEHEWHAI